MKVTSLKTASAASRYSVGMFSAGLFTVFGHFALVLSK